MMVWVYDKRPRNGSQFVYFGMLPIDPKSAEAQVLIPYTRGVLDALGMAHGVSLCCCFCFFIVHVCNLPVNACTYAHSIHFVFAHII